VTTEFTKASVGLSSIGLLL